MKKQNIMGALVFAILLIPAAVIALNLPNFAYNSERESGHISLVVYQIGLSHVTMTVPVVFSDSMATISIPSSAIPQTIRVMGVEVESMRLRQNVPQSLLVKGDSVVVHTQSASYIGTYEGIRDNYLVILQEGKSALVDLSAITAIEVSRAVAMEAQYGTITLEIKANVSGPQTLNVSFLSRATSWKPSHFLDLEDGKIQTWAIVESSENWTDVSLTLVVGQPHIVFEGPIYAYDGAAFAKSREFSVMGLEEYHAYKYGKPFTISSGETAMVLLLSGTLKVEEEYFWAGDYYQSSSTPVEYVNITNTMDEPIPEGSIQFYRGNEWVGNDLVPYVAVNSTAKMMVAYAHDLKVEQKTVKIEHLSGVDKVTVQVKVTSYKEEGISITIQQTIPYRATLELANPTPRQEGQVLTWTESLGPGEYEIITYTYSIPVEKAL